MSTNETTHETLKTVLRAHHRAILGEPIAEDLADALPQKTIERIEPRADRAVGVRIREQKSGELRTARVMPELGGLMLRWLSLFTSPYFNPVKSGESELHYLYVLAGLPFHRVMVGGAPGEQIGLGPDHYDLRPQYLVVELPRRPTTSARLRAVRQALAAYDLNADRLGLADLLSREQYEEKLWEVYALFDARLGHILRPPLAVAAE